LGVPISEQFQGYFPQPEETEKFVAGLRYPTIAQGGPKLRASDNDALLYKALLAVKPNYSRVAQAIGSCVGHGYALAVDILSAVEIAVHGEAEDWPGRTLEASIYGFSRVEARNKTRAGRGDGSYGGAACKALMKYGCLHYNVDYDGEKFIKYSGKREKEWGDTGVPDRLEPFAKKRLVRETTRVKSFDDCAKALSSGYPLSFCSNYGFTNFKRDDDGFCRRRGSWSHCMAGISYRGGRRPGVLICNSWGPRSNSGPHYPDNMPIFFRGCTFWVDADDIDGMCRQNDSFALSGYDGFPPRKLPDWTGGLL
jgi:hypothetical protein